MRSDGTVAAWGDNSLGQISVPPGLNNVVAVAGGGGHSLALTASGAVVAWGSDFSGQCHLPATLANIVSLACGDDHSLLLVTTTLPTPELLNPLRTPQTFSVLIQTLYRKHYALDFKNSLTVADWNSVSTNAGNGALELLTDRAATTTQRFYRLRQW